MINPIEKYNCKFTKEKRNKTITAIGGIASAIGGACIPVYKSKDCEDIIYELPSSLKNAISKEKFVLCKKKYKVPNYPLKILLTLLCGIAGAKLTKCIINKNNNAKINQ